MNFSRRYSFIFFTILASDFVKSDEETIISEIVVTAKKRATSELIGMSLNTISSEKLENNNINDISQLQNMVSGLSIKATEGQTNPIITIRGIGQRVATANSSSSAGYLLDNGSLPTPDYFSFPFFDLNRIEILKGPQNVLYGKNTSAGLLHIISQEPKPDNQTKFNVSYGSFSNITTENVFNAALTKSLAARVSLFSEHSNGHQFNQGTLGEENVTIAPGIIPAVGQTSSSRFGKANKLAARLALKFDQGDLKIKTQLQYFRDKSQVWQRKLQGRDVRNFTDPSADPFDVITNTSPNIDANQSSARIQIKYDLGKTLFESVSAADHINKSLITDDSSPTRLAEQQFDSNNSSFSQEFRLSSSEHQESYWQIGLLFAYDNVDHIKQTIAYDVAATAAQTNFSRQSNSSSMYYHIEYPFKKDFRINLGGRYIIESRSFAANSFDADPFNVSPNPFPNLPLVIDDRLNAKALVWNMSAEYSFSLGEIMYASYSKGFKSGGYDGSILLTAGAAEPFSEETVNSYELGYKYNNAGLSMSAALFYNQYNNFQAQSTVFVSTGVGTIPDARIINAGNAKTKGIELSLDWQANSNWKFSFFTQYLNTEITSFTSDSNAEQFSGNELPDAPQFTYSINAQYNKSIRSEFNFTTGLNYYYTDDIFRDVNNSSSLASDSYGLLDVFVTIQPKHSNWKLNLSLKNISNETYTTSNYFGAFGGVTKLYGLPRNYSLSCSYSF